MSNTGKKVAATLVATAAAIALLMGVFSLPQGSNAQSTDCVTKLKETNVRQGLGLTDAQIDAKCAAVPTTTVAQTTSTSPATGATTTVAQTTAPTTTVAASMSTTTTVTMPPTTAAPASTTPVTGTTVLLTSTGTMPSLPLDASHDAWKISENSDINKDPIVKNWLARIKDPAPALWEVYPNVPNPKVPAFRVKNGKQVPDGLEYGMDNAPFCQQDERCDLIVSAWHYRLVTGDYSFLGRTCQSDGTFGCGLVLINVMDKSYTWRDQAVDNGFTVTGRYWNGDALEWGIWGLVSHASANMLGMPTYRNPLTGDVLNASGGANAGANCGNPKACPNVRWLVVVHAGDRVLATAETTVMR